MKRVIQSFSIWIFLLLGAIAGPLPAHNPPLFFGATNGFVFAGLTGLYSTRLVNPSYTGNAMTIRRVSDGMTLPIAYINGDLDNSSVLAFCVATNCTAQIWNDQSGLTHDIQSGGGPTIVIGGSIVHTINGHTCLTNLGNAAIDVGPAENYITATTFTTYAVGHATSGANSNMLTRLNRIGISGEFAGGIYGLGFAQTVFVGSPAFVPWRVTSDTVVHFASVPYTFGTDGFFAMRLNTTDVIPFKGYLNGGTPGTDNGTLTMATASGEFSTPYSSFTGWTCELAIWQPELSIPQMNDTMANVAAWWGPLWTPITQ